MGEAGRRWFNKRRGIHAKANPVSWKTCRPSGTVDAALMLGPRRRAPRGEAGMTGPQMRQSTRVIPSCLQADAVMGEFRRKLSHRGLWLHARVIPAPFPSGKTGHISGAMDANMEWTRISDDQRPRAWKRGSPEPEPGDQPDQPDDPPRQAPVKQQLFHKVPRREVRVPLRRCPSRTSVLPNSSTPKARS